MAEVIRGSVRVPAVVSEPGLKADKCRCKDACRKEASVRRGQGATQQVRLGALERLEAAVIDKQILNEAGLVSPGVRRVKMILSGEITKPLILKGLAVTAAAAQAIAAAGGKVETE